MSLLYACGSNANGQLGINSQNDSHKFTSCPLDNSQPITKISAGGNHAILLFRDGTIMLSGSYTLKSEHSFTSLNFTSPPQHWHSLTNLIPIVDVACGWSFTAFVTSQGHVYTVGRGGHGELGLGRDCTSVDFPSQVMGLGLQGVIKVACGLRHTVVLCNDGSVWGWGFSRYGQLGVINNTHEIIASKQSREIWTPYRIYPSSDSAYQKIISISCGQHFTAFLTCMGEVLTFGHNKYSQLGHSFTNIVPFSVIPTPVPNLPSRVVQISTGWNHMAALLDSGEVWTWGRNDHGQLGTDSINADSTSLPVKIPLQSKVSEICCGSEHTVVVTCDRSHLFTWGWNEHGNCGTGDILDVREPKEIEPVGNESTTWLGKIRGIGVGCASLWVWKEAI